MWRSSVPTLVLPDLGDNSFNPFEPAPAIPPQSAMRRSRQQPREPEPATNSTPRHPIPIMQEAFKESLDEATDNNAPEKPKLRIGDAKYRRGLVVSQAEGSRKLESDLARWRKRPGQKHHEIWKLIAQISFGVYLLLTGQANNERQVVGILQGHIDDVDEFLEVTMEDLEYAVDDLTDRMSLLQLAVKNMDVFEKMLEDRNYRFQIVSGNEKIEKILTPTRRCLEETAKDVSEGLDAVREFAIYLSKQQDGAWREKRPRVVDIFNAMKSNTEGWFNALMELESKHKVLDALVGNLSGIVSEMDRKAGEVSRRTRFSINPYSAPGPEPRSGDSTPRASVMSPKTSSLSSRESKASVAFNPRESSVRRASGSGQNHADIAARIASRESRETLSTYQFKIPRHGVPGSVEETREEEDEELSSDDDLTERGSMAEIDGSTGNDEPMYILQPRTYTPQPPAPMPSPIHANHPQRQGQKCEQSEGFQRISEPPWKRTSLRDRVSQRTHPPESIQVPPLNVVDFRGPVQQNPSPRPAATFPAPDSAYGSDVERRPTINSVVTDASIPEMSPPIFNRGLMPSPRSDQQRYFPVQASPHSPLQQRPWTSGDTAMNPSQGSQNHYSSHGGGGHVRNKPSQMNMSTLSNVTSVSDLRSETGRSVNTTTTNGQLKKKRSAFGWLKKAFSLDDEERAQFEARKHQPVHNPYMEGRSPRYLDGRRM
ncbi:hypothetical protein MKZ38_010416 [Zalerion maritima]|uniref:Uncharacterized protein n=1 Tax=Zalerion maritima TaxID=339359 RepID=A0AAD5RJK3_9PEZI|nr:hypothetical protein MKZ38_010416 [Zalerion maritima]